MKQGDEIKDKTADEKMTRHQMIIKIHDKRRTKDKEHVTDAEYVYDVNVR